PAIPLILIRPFLPESPAWKQKKTAGTLKRPSIAELFAPGLRRTTVITTIMFALSFGAAFGAIQQTTQIAPGMPDVIAKATQTLESSDLQKAIDRRLASPEVQNLLANKSPDEQAKIRVTQAGIAKQQLKSSVEQAAGSDYSKVQEIGGLFGRFLLALLVVRIASRRNLLRVFQIPGLIVLPLTFGYLALHNQELFTIANWHVTLFDIGIFLSGLFTIAQFSFWGNYLPRVYPLHLRGTGEGFAANIGGRMLGTSFAALATFLASRDFMPGEGDPQKMAYTAAAIGFGVYFLGLVFSFFLPEPPQEKLLE
ncbi:MAG TPA: MFS transporter, partial [Pirellulales bacterium]|nr:MFS transporter [Pirellulales bacterium]